MKKAVLGRITTISAIMAFSVGALAQGADVGKIEYQSSCASCHGLDAKATDQ
jgi:mono/diheme cytochrome c family protein